MSRAGGKISGDFWTCRVRDLRAGDHVAICSWQGEVWRGGPTMVVTDVRPTGLRDGFMFVDTYERDMPRNERQFCIRRDDRVTVVARDVVDKKVEKERVVKGPQLKLPGI